MNKHETDAIRRSHVRSRIYQPASMFVLMRPGQLGEVVDIAKKGRSLLDEESCTGLQRMYRVCNHTK